MTAPIIPDPPPTRPIVIGVYGIPGSGKSHLLRRLKQDVEMTKFSFYEGSSLIDAVTPGGLMAFQRLSQEEKMRHRQLAIGMAAHEASTMETSALVAGHLLFWDEGEKEGTLVHTATDLETFTHILFLDVPAKIIAQQRESNSEKKRPPASVEHLHVWKQTEKQELGRLCRNNGILFMSLNPHTTPLCKMVALMKDFAQHEESYNLQLAKVKMDEVVAGVEGRMGTMLVMDADRTLAAVDAGALFWKRLADPEQSLIENDPLKALFGGSLGYTYTAFRQATLLYEEAANDEEFEAHCQSVASAVDVHPEFLSLLRAGAGKSNVGMVVVTCGLRRVWEKVLEKEGLSQTVKVIGGGRIRDGIVITASVKAALVAHLRQVHHLYVWAFGDSPLDLTMLQNANQAVVIVGEESTRSQSMDDQLDSATKEENFHPRQALLPDTATPRLNNVRLPIVNIGIRQFRDSVFIPRVMHETDSNAAKLLMTPMRNAAYSGPALREAHQVVGFHLAMNALSKMIGLEEYSIPHVQGSNTQGHRFFEEKRTTIVALMRGGEPMALGVNDAMPLAMLVHARDAADLKRCHVELQHQVVLVDSVINSGASVVAFVNHLRNLDSRNRPIRIFVVAGVVHAMAVREGPLAEMLAQDLNLSLAALRLSHNKFTGTKGTDTGNRLFNTCQLE